MPTIRYNRFWCSKCQEFTLQEPNGGQCKVCGTVTTEYKFSGVPEEKLVEQRARYNKSHYDKTFGIYNAFMLGHGIEHLFSEVGSDVDIHEDDAGQKEIDEANRKRYAERRLAREKLQEEYKLFKGTGRNEPCPCGSGVKYKRCCQSKYSTI